MIKAEQFELRAASRVWAILSVQPNGIKTLDHALTEYDVCMCPGFIAYDSSGQRLSLNLGSQIYLTTPDGGIRLKLQMGEAGEILDVLDPKGQARLVIKLSGGGSVGDDPVKTGEYFFNLKWIAPAG